MNELTVTAAQLRNKAQELEDLNNLLKGENDQMKEKEGALNGMWDGDANNAFHTAFNNDSIQIQNFYNAIAAYISTLRTIAQNYEQTEQRNQEIANERRY